MLTRRSAHASGRETPGLTAGLASHISENGFSNRNSMQWFARSGPEGINRTRYGFLQQSRSILGGSGRQAITLGECSQEPRVVGCLQLPVHAPTRASHRSCMQSLSLCRTNIWVSLRRTARRVSLQPSKSFWNLLCLDHTFFRRCLQPSHPPLDLLCCLRV